MTTYELKIPEPTESATLVVYNEEQIYRLTIQAAKPDAVDKHNLWLGDYLDIGREGNVYKFIVHDELLPTEIQAALVRVWTKRLIRALDVRLRQVKNRAYFLDTVIRALSRPYSAPGLPSPDSLADYVAYQGRANPSQYVYRMTYERIARNIEDAHANGQKALIVWNSHLSWNPAYVRREPVHVYHYKGAAYNAHLVIGPEEAIQKILKRLSEWRAEVYAIQDGMLKPI